MLIFTYGSLMSGLGNHSVMVNAGGRFIKEARIKGILRAYCSAFPGAYAPEGGTKDTLIKGEIYEVDAQGLARLDTLEGEGHFYHRKVTTTEEGDEVSVYLLEPSHHKGPLIMSGDWRKHKAEADANSPKRAHFFMGHGSTGWWEQG